MQVYRKCRSKGMEREGDDGDGGGGGGGNE